MKRRDFLKLATGSTATFMLLNGCSLPLPIAAPTPALAPSPTEPAPEARTNLRVAFPGIPKQLDPALYSVIEEHQIGFAIFDGLVWVDAKLTPQPMLAVTWDSTPDLLSWTFTLREDVKFHHGTPLTAQDVVYTFQRILDPKVGSSFRSTLNFVELVEAVDEYTVRFHLTTPSAELPLLLGAPQARIVAHDYRANALSLQPSGTGPFQFVSYAAGVGVDMVRNPTYWGEGQPILERIEYQFMPYATQAAALINGEIDMMAQVGIEDWAMLDAEPAVTVAEVESGAYQTIVMRATKAPFNDLRVRQALKYCVDRNAMQRTVLHGKGTPGNDQPVAQIDPFWSDLPLRDYDPDKAGQLLAAAGFAKGLQLDLVTSMVRPGMTEMALAFQEMAKPAGVKIRVVQVSPSVYWSDYAGKVSFHTGNWGFRPSIDETLMVAYSSRSKENESNWRNPALDKLIDDARGQRNPAQRKELYGQAQQLLMEEGAVIIPYFKPTLLALRGNIQNFTPHPAGWLDFRTTSLG